MMSFTENNIPYVFLELIHIKKIMAGNQ